MYIILKYTIFAPFKLTIMAKKPTTVRLSDEVKEVLEKLVVKRQSTQTNIIEEAIRDLAKKEKIK